MNLSNVQSPLDQVFAYSVLDHMGEGVYVTDAKGLITYINPAAEQILGWSKKDLLGKDMHEMVHHHHPNGQFFPKATCAIIGVDTLEQALYEQQDFFIAKDGSFLPVSYTATPLMIQNRPQGIIVTFHSAVHKEGAFTQFKELDNQVSLLYDDLLEAKSQLEAIDKAMPFGIWTCDASGEVTYISDSLLALTGTSLADYQKFGWLSLMPPENQERAHILWDEAVKHGNLFSDEYLFLGTDGQYHPVLSRGVPLHDAEGNITSWVGINLDISDIKNLELELNTAKDIAETANARKSQFLANMSHELRTPLNAVIGYAEMFQNGIAGEINEKQRRYIHNIVSSGKHLLDMVNDILDIAKIEAGQIKLNHQYIDLIPFIDDLKEILMPLTLSKNIDLNFEVDPALSWIVADPSRFKQILINLMSNAIKFNKENGSVTLLMRPTEDKNWTITEIIDTGIGIPEDKIGELFTEFYQVDTSMTRNYEGTGLGLALTRHLINQHGGNIWVNSIEGQGTTFTFLLPAQLRVN